MVKITKRNTVLSQKCIMKRLLHHHIKNESRNTIKRIFHGKKIVLSNSNFMLSPVKHEKTTARGLVPSLSVQAHVFVLFPTLVYTQKMLRRDWTKLQVPVIFM